MKVNDQLHASSALPPG